METAVWGDCIQLVVRPLELVCLLFSRIILPPATDHKSSLHPESHVSFVFSILLSH